MLEFYLDIESNCFMKSTSFNYMLFSAFFSSQSLHVVVFFRFLLAFVVIVLHVFFVGIVLLRSFFEIFFLFLLVLFLELDQVVFVVVVVVLVFVILLSYFDLKYNESL